MLADLGMEVADPADVGLVELADVCMKVEEPAYVGVDVAELASKEVDVVELTDMGM